MAWLRWLGAVLLLAAPMGAHASYEGVYPEPYPTQNYGTGNLICPAHPSKWAKAYTWIGRARSATDGPRFIQMCDYADTADFSVAPFTPYDYAFPLADGTLWREPARWWLLSTAGPCPPGQSADNPAWITRDDRDAAGNPIFGTGKFQISGGGGCNSGPVMR